MSKRETILDGKLIAVYIRELEYMARKFRYSNYEDGATITLSALHMIICGMGFSNHDITHGHHRKQIYRKLKKIGYNQIKI